MDEIITSNPNDFHNKTLQSATTAIFMIAEKVRRYTFQTAYIMAQVDETECYKDDGFNSVHEWAMQTFGFKKSSSYTLLRVGKEYTRVTKGESINYGSNLIPEHSEEDFTTTQIEKMLPVGHEKAVELVQYGYVTPDMSCREIAKIIKRYTTEEESDQTEESDQPEESDQTEDVAIVVSDEYGTTYRIPSSILDKYRVE